MAVAFEVVTDLPVAPERAFDLACDVEAHVASMTRSAARIRAIESVCCTP